MSSIYHHIGSALGCIRPRVVDDDDEQTARPPVTGQPPPPPRTPGAGADIASGLRYGVEVEHQKLSTDKVARIVRSYTKGTHYNAESPYVLGRDGRPWTLDHDGGGVELVTPILQGRADLQLLQKMVKALKKAGGQTDARAGLHVHIGAERFSPEQMERLVVLMARNEHWLYPLWGVHSSRRSNWCMPMDPTRVAKYVQSRNLSAQERVDWLAGACRERGLNLQNWLHPWGEKNTVEFRYLNGTLDGSDIGCAVGFYMAVAERALGSTESVTDADLERSSLPALLQEMDIPRRHPVAAHLYRQLQTRIREGWLPDRFGPLPDLTALLRDDDFVHQLCLQLDPADQPLQVALTVRALMPLSDKETAQHETLARALESTIHRCTGMRPEASAVRRLVAQHGTYAGNIETYLTILGGVDIPSEHMDETLTFLGRNMLNGDHMRGACDVAVMLEKDHYHERFAVLGDLLGLPAAEFANLHVVLKSMPGDVGTVLGHRLLLMQRSGENIQLIGSKLLARRDDLMRDPRRVLNEVLLDICYDLD